MADSPRWTDNAEKLHGFKEDEEEMGGEALEEGQLASSYVVVCGLTKGQWLTIGIVVTLVAGTVGAGIWCFTGTCGS
jgi:hypothetical protein